MDELKYQVAINYFPSFRSTHLFKLQKFFPSAKIAFDASVTELVNAGINQKLAENFVSFRSQIDVDRKWQALIDEGVKIVQFDDPEYPNLLKKIYDPPAILYYKGQFPEKDARYIAIVGTRGMTVYGRQVVNDIVPQLARSGLVIVSGLAIGIDAEAHNATLRTGGKTIAVLGSGIDRRSIYPRTNFYLAERIISDGGMVLSEYPPGTQPAKFSFPERNRIIAGLSEGVVVIEAKEGSGALITAHFAVDEGRNVFAVPGHITAETSFGPNELIKTGAHPVTSANDILSVLDIKITEIKSQPKLNEVESKILSILSKEPLFIDDISRAASLDIAKLSSTLAVMEINGIVRNVGGMNYVIAF